MSFSISISLASAGVRTVNTVCSVAIVEQLIEKYLGGLRKGKGKSKSQPSGPGECIISRQVLTATAAGEGAIMAKVKVSQKQQPTSIETPITPREKLALELLNLHDAAEGVGGWKTISFTASTDSRRRG